MKALPCNFFNLTNGEKMKISALAFPNDIHKYISDINELCFLGHLCYELYEKKAESVTISEEEWFEYGFDYCDIKGLGNKYQAIGGFSFEIITNEETLHEDYKYTRIEHENGHDIDIDLLKTPYLEFDDAFGEYVEGLLTPEVMKKTSPGSNLKNDLHWATPRQYIIKSRHPLKTSTEEEENLNSSKDIFLGLICYRTDLGKKTCHILPEELAALGINFKKLIPIITDLSEQDIISVKFTNSKDNYLDFEYTLKKYCSSKPIETLLD